jgi:hypothetical protein
LQESATLRRQAHGRPVLRGLPRRDLQHRPLQEGRCQGARRRAWPSSRRTARS